MVSFQPLAKVTRRRGRSRLGANEIDRFVFQRLSAEGCSRRRAPKKATLLRRVYFDVIGLPPTPEEWPLSSPTHLRGLRKGGRSAPGEPALREQWARHWLDLVRYAESDGFRIDDFRPHACAIGLRHRSLNDDKPYSRFVQEQIAATNSSRDLEARIGTGYLRHWIYEYNNRDAVGSGPTSSTISRHDGGCLPRMGVQCRAATTTSSTRFCKRITIAAASSPHPARDDLKLPRPGNAEYARK